MAYNLNNKLVIAISSRALFDLEETKDNENKFTSIVKREQKFIYGIKELLWYL